jgi:hypothetical protein
MDFLIRLFGTVVGYLFGLFLIFAAAACKALGQLIWQGLLAWWEYLTHPKPSSHQAKARAAVSSSPAPPVAHQPMVSSAPITPPKPQAQVWSETSRAPTPREPKPNHGYQVTSK